MKINITPTLYSKLNILSSEYNIEVGGYLTGMTKDGEIYLDDLLIPDQIITHTSVEISSQNQISLLKKYGEKCKMIVGHWHSHHNMGCFWSNIDMDNMNNIMSHKDFFIFIVSSVGKHLSRVCIRKPITFDFEDVNLYIKSLNLDQMRYRVNLLFKSKNNNYNNNDGAKENKTFDSEEIENE